MPASLVTGGYDEDDSDPAVIKTEDFDDPGLPSEVIVGMADLAPLVVGDSAE